MFLKKKRIINKKLLKEFEAMLCAACMEKSPCAHHLKSVGAGGDDVEENLLALCKPCHTLIHKIGLNDFIKEYPIIKNIIEKKGWEFDGFKWRKYEV